MSFYFGNAICVVALVGIIVPIMLGCSSKLAEPEPIPEVIVNDLAAKETGLWKAFQKKDHQHLARFLAYDYMTVSDRGPMDKDAKIASIDDENVAEYSIRDLRATLLGSNYVLLTYSCKSKGSRHGGTFEDNSICSDIWISRGGAWQSIFFEDRPVREQTLAALRSHVRE